MELKIFKDYEALSLAASEEIIRVIKTNPAAVLCLATGQSPVLTYQLFVEKIIAENIDLSRCTFIGLDEWVGIPPEMEGSCQHFLQNKIFKPLQIKSSQIHLFNALATDVTEECKRMDRIIEEKGGIDFMLVGVGMNGHIGFNEPGVDINKYAHVIELDETTKAVGQKKYFDKPVNIGKGITLGLQNFLEAGYAVMIANGNKKAPVIKKAMEEEIGTQFPATIMRMHKNSMMMVDEEAASLLDKP
ncbi:glucosamine-6-phosphate deaminase [Panacibacter ginsenosidivorans]|uniref:Glucosamine-6-phosphate deaminase n=1 Tax=Panacibacter ginsenosidivorans TaxID=1813871 RepID=A0A5B8V5B1_9BACT|nr:glucosamine-6-phosphate deaminase [Panacibacter ginsenosidivorans]QEC65901.1 glucosamine-6-phosphate deaminase [Panacibacter ginsenosidivorans]